MVYSRRLINSQAALRKLRPRSFALCEDPHGTCMETLNMPRRLTTQEFDSMMHEFDMAGEWMCKQLVQKRAQSQLAGPEPLSQGADSITRSEDT